MVTFRDFLTTLSDKELDTPVIMAKDAEGNSFSPLESFSFGKYVVQETWCGDFYDEDDDPNLWEGYPDDSIKVICLWPTN